MYEEHQEGQITFLRPPLQKVPTTSMPVFYNPQSELNRDVTISVIQVFINQYEKALLRVCTPLAGTGVRAVRIAKEVKGIDKIVAGDANPLAVKLIRKNCKLNKLTNTIKIFNAEANQLLTQFTRPERKFDVIDIDPFGSPRQFLSTAFSALKQHGLLCLTATDMPVLIGIRPRTCIKRYGATPAKTDYGHELAVRLLLGCAVREAAAQDIGVQPLLSFSIDHYVRLYCETTIGDENTWKAISNLGYLNHCAKCGYRELSKGLVPIQPNCPNCQSEQVQQAGPLWAGILADNAFLERVIQITGNLTLGTKKRLLQLLNRMKEENDGPPTFFDLHKEADRLGIPVPAFDTIITILRSQGYFCSRTHYTPHAIRTDAPPDVLFQALKDLTAGDLGGALE